ncbi:MAG: hypothetical protein AAF721_06395 [Myxococcota bacterium]
MREGSSPPIVAVPALLAGLAIACHGGGAFECATDQQCTNAGATGLCQPEGYCSFADDVCPSGQRYGEHAGAGLAAACVPLPTTGSTTDGVGSSTQAMPVEASTSNAVLDSGSSGAATDSGGSRGSSTGSELPDSTTNGGDASTTFAFGSTGGDALLLYDDFNRPDSPQLGNDWIERTPGVFALVDERVVFDGDSQAFENSVFYRPFDEALLDVEVSLEFVFVAVPNSSTPQVHVRIQEDSLAEVGEETAYLLYVPNTSTLTFTRVELGSFALSASEVIDPPLIMGPTYRLRFAVSGVDPVELTGSVETLSEGTWTVLQTIAVTDDDPSRIQDAGSYGASAHFDPVFEYDNYSAMQL